MMTGRQLAGDVSPHAEIVKCLTGEPRSEPAHMDG